MGTSRIGYLLWVLSFNCPWCVTVKTYCRHSENVLVLSQWCLTMKQCQMQNCFLPKWSATGAANCAMRRYKHGKVDMKGVFSVSVVHWNVDSDIVTKGASVQSCKALTNSLTRRWLSGGQLPPMVYDFTFHHPTSKQYQTIEWMEILCFWFYEWFVPQESRICILRACHIGLPEGTWVLSSVLTVQLPTKDIDNILARTCTNNPHWFPKACSPNL